MENLEKFDTIHLVLDEDEKYQQAISLLDSYVTAYQLLDRNLVNIGQIKTCLQKIFTRITGWSIATIHRARNGVEEFKKDREEQRIAQQERSKKKAAVEMISDTVRDILNTPVLSPRWAKLVHPQEDDEEQGVVECVAEAEQYSLEDVVRFLKAQNNLISQLIDLWS